MKKIVLKVAAVALCMSGFLAVNANNVNQPPTCEKANPILEGECSGTLQVPCCVSAQGTTYFQTAV
ncbi:MAG: hypothetical protein MI921_09645 [Cytophagales bacterium]|nr:hypothetical protein [Cytophagales bacterium]